MTTDMAYCNGNNCPIKDKCKRFIDITAFDAFSTEGLISWTDPLYSEKEKHCPLFIKSERHGDTSGL